MADFNKPANATSGWLDTFTEIKNAISSVAQMFDGTSDTNVPTGAKRIDSTTKEIFEYNGATWDSLGFVSDTAAPVAASDIVTTVGVTGSDTKVPSEQAVREAITAGGGAGVGLVEVWTAVTATGSGDGSDTSNRIAAKDLFNSSTSSDQVIFSDAIIHMAAGDYKASDSLEIAVAGSRVLILIEGNVTVQDVQAADGANLSVFGSSASLNFDADSIHARNSSKIIMGYLINALDQDGPIVYHSLGTVTTTDTGGGGGLTAIDGSMIQVEESVNANVDCGRGSKLVAVTLTATSVFKVYEASSAFINGVLTCSGTFWAYGASLVSAISTAALSGSSIVIERGATVDISNLTITGTQATSVVRSAGDLIYTSSSGTLPTASNNGRLTDH